MAMIKCKNCGKTISEDSKTCIYCGEKNEVMRCPKCDSKNVGFEAEFADSPGYRIKKALFGCLLFGKNEDGAVIKYVCKDCGKKFKNK